MHRVDTGCAPGRHRVCTGRERVCTGLHIKRLQYYTATILQYYNTTILQYYTTTILHDYNSTRLHDDTTALSCGLTRGTNSTLGELSPLSSSTLCQTPVARPAAKAAPIAVVSISRGRTTGTWISSVPLSGS